MLNLKFILPPESGTLKPVLSKFAIASEMPVIKHFALK